MGFGAPFRSCRGAIRSPLSLLQMNHRLPSAADHSVSPHRAAPPAAALPCRPPPGLRRPRRRRPPVPLRPGRPPLADGLAQRRARLGAAGRLRGGAASLRAGLRLHARPRLSPPTPHLGRNPCGGPWDAPGLLGGFFTARFAAFFVFFFFSFWFCFVLVIKQHETRGGGWGVLRPTGGALPGGAALSPQLVGWRPEAALAAAAPGAAAVPP